MCWVWEFIIFDEMNIFLGPHGPTGTILVPVEIELVPRFGLLPSPHPGTPGGSTIGGPLLKIQMGLQRAVAGVQVGTSISGVGTDETIHAIISFSLTHKCSNFLQRHHALDTHTTNFHTAAISRFPKFIFVIFGSFFLTLSNLFFSFRAGWPNFFPESLS